MTSYVEHGPEKKTIPPRPVKYPPRDGFDQVVGRNGAVVTGISGGYTSRMARPCKCGGQARFQQVYAEKTDVAQTFVGVCPVCCRRTVAEGSLEDVLAGWNRWEFTADSEMVSGRLKNPDDRAMISLCKCVVNDAIMEAIKIVRELRDQREAEEKLKQAERALRNRAMDIEDKMGEPDISEARMKTYEKRLESVSDEITRISIKLCAATETIKKTKGRLLRYQRFFETSPLMYERDAESALSDIRKAVHPDLTPEERVKIPLKLVSM